MEGDGDGWSEAEEPVLPQDDEPLLEEEEVKEPDPLQVVPLEEGPAHLQDCIWNWFLFLTNSGRCDPKIVRRTCGSDIAGKVT